MLCYVQTKTFSPNICHTIIKETGTVSYTILHTALCLRAVGTDCGKHNIRLVNREWRMLLTIRKVAPIMTAFILTSKSIGTDKRERGREEEGRKGGEIE